MVHRIEMLGTGNAFLPHGRHHSFALFGQHHIIDAPTALAAFAERALMSPLFKRCSLHTSTEIMSSDSRSFFWNENTSQTEKGSNR